MRSSLTAATIFAALMAAALPASGQDAKPELSRVRLAVGGKPALFYLPLTVTDRLGYFKDEGLDVTISDLAGGAIRLDPAGNAGGRRESPPDLAVRKAPDAVGPARVAAQIGRAHV